MPTLLARFANPARPRLLALLAWAAVTLLVALAPFWLLDAYWTRQVVLILLLALVVSGLNLTFGWAGELSLGQPFMYGAGAYAAGWTTIHVHNDILLSAVVGAAAALIAGLVSGIPGLRLGGWMLAITSFFLVLLIPALIRIIPADQLGGAIGLIGIPPPTALGQVLDPREFFAVVAVVTSLWFALLRNLLISGTGTAFLTLRYSSTLAASLGMSHYRLKLLAYALGAVPAGVAGALFAQLDLFISPASFPLSLAITILAASIIGGAQSIYGAFAGAAAIHLFQTRSTGFEDYALIGYGALLIVGGVLFGGGIAGLVALLWRRVRGRRTSPTSVVSPAGALPPMVGARLQVTGVSRSFGGARALDGASLTAEPGQITALIGPNGSGKTTLLNAISGMTVPDAGQIVLGDKELTGQKPFQVARLGVSRTFQTPMIPERLVVRDAIGAGRHAVERVSTVATVLRLPSLRRSQRAQAAVVDGVIAALRLSETADRTAADLSLGTRRMVELARSLVASPSLLLLDEVASGLDTDEIDDLVRLLARLRDLGATVVLVEHNFSLVRSIADRVVVLADGRVLAAGSPDEIAEHPEVLERYLGAGAGVSGTTVVNDGRDS